VLALAQATFRSVSLDKLEPKHLASNELAADAYAITNAAPLGSIDVRARATRRRASERARASRSAGCSRERLLPSARSHLKMNTRARCAQAFLSHSWHDSPVEKWRLLQAWRADFVKAHGREPTM
jgi:hypothetical protein